MDVLKDFLALAARDVEVALDRLLPSAEAEPKRLHEAIRWSVFAGGKRIRPAIVFAVGRAFDVSNSTLSRTAAAVEMIHTYSLIHDDLPAMDNDDLRRGRATCHIQFGEATAILAGDVLQTLAFKAIADDDALPVTIRVRIISELALAAGTPAGMVAGQQLDLEAEGSSLSIGDLESIHRKKTGALISAAAVAGAIMGSATENELAAVKKYASRLGLLFQITDDLLDVTQETDALGKTAGKDAAAGKATYPAHYGIEKSIEMGRIICSEACEALSPIRKDNDLLRQLADFILNRTR